MAHLLVTHKVRDFDTWKPFFEADKARRAEFGITDVCIFHEHENPNNFFILFDIDNPSRLDEFFGNPELAEIMKNAGVLEQPTAMIAV